MAKEMPTFAASSYSSSTADIGSWGLPESALTLDAGHQTGMLRGSGGHRPILHAHFQPEELNMAVAVGRRVVQVFVSDPDPKVPLDKCLLYQGDVKVTDATDQELYFELDIKALLEKHNAERIKIVDKSVKDRTELLEPAKIRDLKMSVVTITNL